MNYIWVAIVASVVAFYAQSFLHRKGINRLMLYLDGLGAALFGIEATVKAWYLGFGLPVAPVILGIVTAIGGGLIRDVLAGRQTLLMKRELYAIPVMLGCTLHIVSLTTIPQHGFASGIVCMLLTFSIRAAAIHWDLSVPRWLLTQPPHQSEANDDAQSVTDSHTHDEKQMRG